MSDVVTLAEIERLCWHLSGWSVDQRSVDELLAAIRLYAHSVVPLAEAVATASDPVPQEPVCAPASTEPDPEHPEPEREAHSGTRRADWKGELTVRVVIGGKSSRRGPMTPLERAANDVSDSKKRRTCRKCSTDQPLTEFMRNSRMTGHRKTVCRTCENTRKREARAQARAQAQVQAETA